MSGRQLARSLKVKLEAQLEEKLDWFEQVVNFTRGFEAKTKGSPRAKHSVYAVLLRDEEGDRWGLYVGMTGLAPEQRFLRHKAGVQSGKKWVKRFGVTLAPSIYAHLNPCEYEEALQLEKLLLATLPAAGVPWVEGN